MKSQKTALSLNIIIVFFVVLGTLLMFTGFKFMPADNLLVASNVEMFKFYTVDSNILMGIASLVFVICDLLFINKKIKDIPEGVYVFKLIATSAVVLTFITTALFLTPQYGFYAMYNNANLFFHLIVPIISVVSYVCYEKHLVDYTNALLALVPMFAYSIYYTSNILLNINNGGLTYKYDFYGFLQGNINSIYYVIPIMFIVSFLISVLLIYLNGKTRTK